MNRLPQLKQKQSKKTEHKQRHSVGWTHWHVVTHRMERKLNVLHLYNDLNTRGELFKAHIDDPDGEVEFIDSLNYLNLLLFFI